ncbi:MAG: GTP-binding protein [bacterium]|nr:GTP-binding protein [bacterium]
MTDYRKMIVQLEKEIGKELKERKFQEIVGFRNQGFALGGDDNVIGLNLDAFGLKRLPESLATFHHLEKLNLIGNQLTDISALQGLTKLTELSLGDNQLTDVSILQGLTKLTILYLGSNQLTDVNALQGLTKLTKLKLYKNQLTDVNALQGLTKLTKLILYNNELTDLSALQGLKYLSKLNLRNNQITQLPEKLAGLGMAINVKETIYYGQVGLFLTGNPLESPPLEILQQGGEAVKSYFKSLKKGSLPLNEVKVLLVGEGGAGKTSLVKRLVSGTFDPNESQTHGINIDRWQVKDVKHENDNQGKTITVNLWDFGGQEIMHATHQFFLSQRSLYILVLDGRKDEDAEYWLKHIQSFGGDSPVLVVINKIDENPGFELNRKFLREKYPYINGFYRISCDTKDGLPALEAALKETLKQIRIIKTVWPLQWLNVKKELKNISQHTISYTHYEAVCAKEEITNPSVRETLLDYLNDIGVSLHFKDLELLDTHVLEPRWVTEAVYRIINSKSLAEHSGELNLALLDHILAKKDEDDFEYPRDKHRFIVELMKKFELCYSLDKRRILIPDLLQKEEPSFHVARSGALEFIIAYDFLPKSIMPRFIVQMHQDIKDKLQWRTGVVLEDKRFRSLAVVKADDRDRKISIHVEGGQKRDYFAVILARLRGINQSFEKLETTELVPMPGEPDITAEYNHLIRLEKEGIKDYLPGKSQQKYNVKELLGTITAGETTEEKVLQLLEKLWDEKDTEKTLVKKANDLISYQPSVLGFQLNVGKIAELVEKVFTKKKGKKKDKIAK